MTYQERLNECMAAIKKGDHTKFYELQQISYGPLISVAKIYLLDKSYAKAVVTDLYTRIWRYADHYDETRDAQAYLWQIVKRRAYDYNKRFCKSKTVNVDDIQLSDKIDQFERVEARIDFIRALKRIGPDDAILFLWFYNDGFTQEEIGKMLKVTRSAVCQRLNKIKAKLSEYLK